MSSGLGRKGHRLTGKQTVAWEWAPEPEAGEDLLTGQPTECRQRQLPCSVVMLKGKTYIVTNISAFLHD